MAQDPSDSNGMSAVSGFFREWLATIVVVVSIIGVAILGGIALTTKEPKAETILTMILPMIGTWVGTVLAFYFGKQQLEAATRSVTAIARELTPEEKLKSIKVVDKMIPRSAMHVSKQEPAKLLLLSGLEDLEKTGKGSRLPVLTAEDRPLYVIHRSMIDQFIVKAASGGKTVHALKALTLEDLLADADLKRTLESSLAIVPETATLADAKRAMASSAMCQDAVVTRTGGKDEPVTGWITNVIIEANSKV